MTNINPMVIPTSVLAAVLFAAGQAARQATSSPMRGAALGVLGAVMAIPAVLFAAYYLHLFDNAEWFYRLRAVRFTELTAGGIGLLAGYAARPQGTRSSPTGMIARASFVVLAGVILAAPYAKGLMPADYAGMSDTWSEGVCLQSTPSSCGPSCGATVLRQFGIEATEAELAEECFTSKTSTENWYLARAIRRRGLDVDFSVTGSEAGQLPHPAVVGVRLGEHGPGHFIAVLAREGDEYEIGDPLVGRRDLSRGQIRDAYHLTGFSMVVTRRETSW